MSMTVEEIAAAVGGRFEGAGDTLIEGVEQLSLAGARHIVFIGDQTLAAEWETSGAGAALTSELINLEPDDPRPVIRAADGQAAFIALLTAFAPAPTPAEKGVHETAIVDSSAKLGADVSIGPGCVIGAGVVLGDRTILRARVTIQPEARIGADCCLHPGVVIGERCVLGERVVIHPGAVIGADGFGFRSASDGRGPDGTGIVKVPQIGRVVIGNLVEIGANACVDRGTFSDTVIGDGCKLDNLVQVGHNCRLGRSVIVAGQAGLAGSVEVGDGAMIGGQVGVRDHLKIGRGVKVAACAAVMNDIPDGQTWGGYPAQPFKDAMHERVVIRKMIQSHERGRRSRRSERSEQ